MLWFRRGNQRLRTRDERGVTSVEYGLIIAAVAIVAIPSVIFLQNSLDSSYQATAANEPGVCLGSGCGALDNELPPANIPAPGSFVLAGYHDIYATVNLAITPQNATISGGTGPYDIAVDPPLPAGLTLVSGLLSGEPTAIQDPALYTITATDSLGDTATKTISISVSIANLAWSGYSDVNAFKGVDITDQYPGTSGGTPPYKYSVAPALPDSLNLDPNSGVLSGTPDETQASAPYTITLVDDAGKTKSDEITITVSAPISLDGYASITGVTGTAITTQNPSPDPANGNYSYSISPSATDIGLAFDADTGALSGTPTAYVAAGTEYTITVTDNDTGQTASQTITMNISNPTCDPDQILGTAGTCITTPSVALCYRVKRGTAETYGAFTNFDYATGGYAANLTLVASPGTMTSDKQGFTWSSPNSSNGTRTFDIEFDVTYPSNGATDLGSGTGTVNVTYNNGGSYPNDPEVITCP